MILCPLCHNVTEVAETRTTGSGSAARRRRHCIVPSCKGRVTTVEVAVSRRSGAAFLAGDDTVIVSRKLLNGLLRDLAALAEGCR